MLLAFSQHVGFSQAIRDLCQTAVAGAFFTYSKLRGSLEKNEKGPAYPSSHLGPWSPSALQQVSEKSFIKNCYTSLSEVSIPVFYHPRTIATDSLHCPTLLPADSAERMLQLSRCAEAWRNAGFLEASIDTLIYSSSERIDALVHLGPRYHIAMLGDTSVAFRYEGIPFITAQKFSTRLSNRLSPSDSVTISITLHDSLVTAEAWCDSTAQTPLLDIRQSGKLHLPLRTLYALLRFRRTGATIRQSDLKRVEVVLSSIPYIKVTHSPVLEFVPAGAILHVFLEPRKANTARAGFGFQPKPSGKGVNVYGNADLDLQSLFRQGERFRATWRLLQPTYHRIEVNASWDYIYGSAWGAALGVAFKRRDSSASQFIGSAAIRFFPAAFQSVEAGYCFSRLTENIETSEAHSVGVYQLHANSYSLGYQFEKTNYTTDWPRGHFFKLEAKLSDRQATAGTRGLILGVKAEGATRVALGRRGLQLDVSINYENRDLINTQAIGLRALEYARTGGAKTIRGFLEETIATKHYVAGSTGLSFGVNRWVMPHVFTDAGFFFDAPWLRGVISAGAGITAQAAFGTMVVDVARGFALNSRSPQGDWILHLAASLRF